MDQCQIMWVRFQNAYIVNTGRTAIVPYRDIRGIWETYKTSNKAVRNT